MKQKRRRKVKENMKTEDNSSIANKEATVKRRGTKTYVPRTNETKSRNQIQEKKGQSRIDNQQRDGNTELNMETPNTTKRNKAIKVVVNQEIKNRNQGERRKLDSKREIKKQEEPSRTRDPESCLMGAKSSPIET